MSFCFQVTVLTEARIQSNQGDVFVHFTPWNRQIELRSAGALNQSDFFLIRSCGFATSEEAGAAAADLRQALLLAGAKNVRGIKLYDVKVVEESTPGLFCSADQSLELRNRQICLQRS
jgi:hypothetical protein